jgi:hypothetical protein
MWPWDLGGPLGEHAILTGRGGAELSPSALTVTMAQTPRISSWWTALQWDPIMVTNPFSAPCSRSCCWFLTQCACVLTDLLPGEEDLDATGAPVLVSAAHLAGSDLLLFSKMFREGCGFKPFCFFCIIKVIHSRAPVAHTCNPSYRGSRIEVRSQHRQMTLCQKNPSHTHTKRVGGVGSEIKPQYLQKKKKKTVTKTRHHKVFLWMVGLKPSVTREVLYH